MLAEHGFPFILVTCRPALQAIDGVNRTGSPMTTWHARLQTVSSESATLPQLERCDKMGVLTFTPGIEIAPAPRYAEPFRGGGGRIWVADELLQVPQEQAQQRLPPGTKTMAIGRAPLAPDDGLFSHSALDWHRVN